MKTYSEWILASDLDGTLVNSRHFVDERNIEAVRKMVEGGGIFTVATGRSAQNVRHYIKGIPINAPCILYNGAALYDLERDEFLVKELLDNAAMYPFIERVLRDFKAIVVEIYTPHALCVVSDGSSRDPQIEREHQPHVHTSLDKIAGEEWLKILLCGERGELEKVKAILLDMQVDADYVFSYPIYIEILKSGVNKGTALKRLVSDGKYLGKKIAAVGDFDNDAEMLRAADLGVAVAHASPLCKAAADVITVDYDSCPIAEVIEKLLPSY